MTSLDPVFGWPAINGTWRCPDCGAGRAEPCRPACRRWRPAPGTVLCARCEHPWPENDEGVRYTHVYDGFYDWFCADQTECDDRSYQEVADGV